MSVGNGVGEGGGGEGGGDGEGGGVVGEGGGRSLGGGGSRGSVGHSTSRRRWSLTVSLCGLFHWLLLFARVTSNKSLGISEFSLRF